MIMKQPSFIWIMPPKGLEKLITVLALSFQACMAAASAFIHCKCLE